MSTSVFQRLRDISNADNLGSGVRDRLKTALPAFAVFSILGAFVEPTFWAFWWWYVGVGMLIAAVYIEPFFGTARSGIANSIATIGAIWSADRSQLGSLWYLFLMVCTIIFVTSVLAATLPGDGWFKSLLNQVGTLGRAPALGLATLLLFSASQIAAGKTGYSLIAIGSCVLSLGLLRPWSTIRRAKRPARGTIVDSIGPRLLLVEGDAGRAGSRIVLLGAHGERVEGVRAGRVPESAGPRTLIALSSNWDEVAPSFPRALAIEEESGTTDVVGIASSGSTTTELVFRPFANLAVGACVVSNVDGRDVIYQVVKDQLVDSVWGASRAVVAEARAVQLGVIEGDVLRSHPVLPEPHALLRRAEIQASSTSSSHAAIGFVDGTAVQIGVALASADRGHVAVLGMSGMGKSNVVRKICRALGATQQVVAIDATGEYAGPSGVPVWAIGDYSTSGFFVTEPTGPLAARTQVLIHDFMNQARVEYLASTRVDRLICLEEAHSFIPEWNFATRPEADASALTARYMMQARKYGLSFMVVSQRTAVVSKSALSQCESYIVFRTVDDTSLSYIEGIVGSIAREVLPSLARHHALCFGPAFNAERPVIVRLDP